MLVYCSKLRIVLIFIMYIWMMQIGLSQMSHNCRIFIMVLSFSELRQRKLMCMNIVRLGMMNSRKILLDLVRSIFHCVMSNVCPLFENRWVAWLTCCLVSFQLLVPCSKISIVWIFVVNIIIMISQSSCVRSIMMHCSIGINN